MIISGICSTIALSWLFFPNTNEWWGQTPCKRIARYGMSISGRNSKVVNTRTSQQEGPQVPGRESLSAWHLHVFLRVLWLPLSLILNIRKNEGMVVSAIAGEWMKTCPWLILCNFSGFFIIATCCNSTFQKAEIYFAFCSEDTFTDYYIESKMSQGLLIHFGF